MSRFKAAFEALGIGHSDEELAQGADIHYKHFNRIHGLVREVEDEIKQHIEITNHAIIVFNDTIAKNDDKFLRMLKVLGTMELGPEFFYSYTMLNKIADDIIAGKTVDLNLEEYREKNP